MLIHTLLVLIFGALCFGVGLLVGSRNHARIESDLDDVKSDINALKTKVAFIRQPLPQPTAHIAGSSLSAKPTTTAG